MLKSVTVTSLRLPPTLSSVRTISTSLRSASKVAVASTFRHQSSLTRSPAANHLSSISQRAFSSTPISRFSPTSTMSHNVEKITDAKVFKEKVQEGSGPVIVDCSATWCGPCKAISPVFQRLSTSEEFKNAKFYEIDVDELSEVAAELGVRAMPTFMFFKDGQKVNEVVGANPPALEAAIKAHVA
ncbi:thioredoxin trx1 [Aspergillus fumigatus]